MIEPSMAKANRTKPSRTALEMLTATILKNYPQMKSVTVATPLTLTSCAFIIQHRLGRLSKVFFDILTGVCGIRISANMSVFQTEETGSTPVSRTTHRLVSALLKILANK